MEWPGELWRSLRFPFRRRQFDRDLEEEICDVNSGDSAYAASLPTRYGFDNGSVSEILW
jgi:hypothetical protein